MKKTISIASTLLLASTTLFAGAMGDLDALMVQNGFYIAGALGAGAFGAKESHTLTPETHQLGAMGIIGGGFLGYEYLFERYGVAAEFFADATGFNASITHEPYTYGRQQHYDVGIRVLPEYAFSPSTTGHILLGYTNGSFSLSDNGVYGYLNTGYNQDGFQTGLGFSTLFRPNLSVRLDAIYDIYASNTKTGFGLVPGTLQQYTNTFSTLAGELSLLYKFG